MGDGLNKLILPLKQNQVDRYERCDRHVYFIVLTSFGLLNCQPIVGSVSVTCRPTVDRQVTDSRKWKPLFTSTENSVKSTFFLVVGLEKVVFREGNCQGHLKLQADPA